MATSERHMPSPERPGGSEQMMNNLSRSLPRFHFDRRRPGQALQDGIAVLVGGAFLVTPGILTDLAGLALLFPPTRRIAQRLVRRSLERRIREGALNFVVVGPGMFAGGAGSEETPGRPGEGLDPSKEIRVDDPET